MPASSRDDARILGTALPALSGAGSAGGTQSAGKVACAVLESCDEVRVDRRLAGGIAAGGLGARLVGLGDSQDLVEQLVGVVDAGMLGNHEQDAPVGRLEASEQPPGAVEVKPADIGNRCSR